jgi:hypothetical protein
VKASELIKDLQEIIEKYGDYDVVYGGLYGSFVDDVDMERDWVSNKYRVVIR